MARMAAVSVGSNTVHALIADVTGGRIEEISRRALLSGLGAAVERYGRIGTDKQAEALDHLRKLVEEARQAGSSEILCGATAAVRRAADGPEFIGAAEAVVRLPVRIISGRREAQLSFLGAASTHSYPGRWLLADLGGGSTERVVAEGSSGLVYASLELGSAALAARHLGDPPTGEERAKVRRDALAVLREGPECEPERLVVTGGTSSTLPRILSPANPPAILSRTELLDLAERLDAEPAPSLSRRLDVPEARLRSMRAGVEILLLLLDWCRLDSLHVSHEGIRHGMLIARGLKGAAWWKED